MWHHLYHGCISRKKPMNKFRWLLLREFIRLYFFVGLFWELRLQGIFQGFHWDKLLKLTVCLNCSFVRKWACMMLCGWFTYAFIRGLILNVSLTVAHKKKKSPLKKNCRSVQNLSWPQSKYKKWIKHQNIEFDPIIKSLVKPWLSYKIAHK